MTQHPEPVPTTYEFFKVSMCETVPMSGAKVARLESYRATRDAILNGTQLPAVVNTDAVDMLERELVCCVANLINNQIQRTSAQEQ